MRLPIVSRCASLTALFLAGCAATHPGAESQPGGQDTGAGPAPADAAASPLADTAASPLADVAARPDLATATADGRAMVDATVPPPDPADAAPADGPGGAGCATMAPAGLTRRTIQVDGRARTYLLSAPAPTGASRPLVFAWHGLGGLAMQFRAYSRLEAAIGGGAIVVYPDGLPQPGTGAGAGWNLTPTGDVRLFDAILAEVSASHCVDKARVFSTGHSFGGYMSNTLGCLRTSALRAIAPVAGGLPGAGLPGTRCQGTAVAAWLAHAMNDPVVPFATGEGAHAHWQQAAGCASTTRPTAPSPCVAHDGCTRPVHWCVHTQMHAWPAFAPPAIWAFFSAQ